MEALPRSLEATVGKNVRFLRDSRGLSQQQLGSDLVAYRVGMHQTTVAKLEAGSKPLRLNEVAAIASYFDLPIEALLDPMGTILNEQEETVLLRQVNAALLELTDARADYEDTAAALAGANRAATDALSRHAVNEMWCKNLEGHLSELQRRLEVSQAARTGAALPTKVVAAKLRSTPQGRRSSMKPLKRTTRSRPIRRREAD